MTGTKYKARPIEVEAFQFTGPKFIPESFKKHVSCKSTYGLLYAYTLFGTLYARPGAWIVRGPGDDLRVLSDAAFRGAYEMIEERP